MPASPLGQPYGIGLTEQQTIVVANPAAGANASLKLGASLVGNALWWRLVGVTFKLTTDANAANRYTTVEYQGGDGVAFMADGASVLVTANTTAQRFLGSLSHGTSEWNTSTDVFFPLSGLWLELGTTVVLNVASVQVGDQLSAIRLTFDRVTSRAWERWCDYGSAVEPTSG